jgi:hypothetical protein
LFLSDSDGSANARIPSSDYGWKFTFSMLYVWSEKEMKIFPTKEQIEYCYLELKLNQKKSAYRLGISSTKLIRLMKRYGIKARPGVDKR